MAVTEEQRHVLYTRLEDTLGHDPATTLMESLPPVGWGDVATKQDIALLRKDLEHLATREDVADKLNTHLLAVLGMNITLYGLSFGLLTLLR